MVGGVVVEEDEEGEGEGLEMRAFSAKVAGRDVMFSAASVGGGEVEGEETEFAAGVDAVLEKGFFISRTLE